MIAFLTRYSVGLIIFLILFYIFINRHNVSLEKIFGGILLSLVPELLLFYFFIHIFMIHYTHFILFIAQLRRHGQIHLYITSQILYIS
jgi:hypothetical protein